MKKLWIRIVRMIMNLLLITMNSYVIVWSYKEKYDFVYKNVWFETLRYLFHKTIFTRILSNTSNTKIVFLI